MTRGSDGTDVPIPLAQASSSNVGSLDDSILDLEGTGFRATTMEEKVNEIYLQLPPLHTKHDWDRKLRPDACSDRGRPDGKYYQY